MRARCVTEDIRPFCQCGGMGRTTLRGSGRLVGAARRCGGCTGTRRRRTGSGCGAGRGRALEAGHRGHHVVEKGLPDDPARVVLARVERSPVDVLDVLAELVVNAALGLLEERLGALDQMSKLLRVLRQPLRADDEHGDDEQDEELAAVDVEHGFRILGGQPVADSSRTTRTSRSDDAVRTRRTTASPGVLARIATMSSSGSVTGRPSIARMTSPRRIPARSAGPPGDTAGVEPWSSFDTWTPSPTYRWSRSTPMIG